MQSKIQVLEVLFQGSNDTILAFDSEGAMAENSHLFYDNLKEALNERDMLADYLRPDLGIQVIADPMKALRALIDCDLDGGGYDFFFTFTWYELDLITAKEATNAN